MLLTLQQLLGPCQQCLPLHRCSSIKLGHSPVSKWIRKDQDQEQPQASCCGASQWTTINLQYHQEALVAPLSLALLVSWYVQTTLGTHS